MTPRLQVRDLGVGFAGRRVVDGLDLDLSLGEIVGLVGPSGSGKSLSVRALLGLTPSGAEVTGSVRLDGRELIGLPERDLRTVRGRGMGLVFQDSSAALDPVMPICEQVAEGLRQGGVSSRREAQAQALGWLARVGLDPAVVPPQRRPHQLSGGQRQRVAIAAALALRPAILVADEPTTALDALAQAEIAALLAELTRSEGLALLLVSHDLALVAGIADRLVVLQDGRSVAAGATLQIMDDPGPQLVGLRRALALSPRTAASLAQPQAFGSVVLRAEGLSRVYPPPRAWPLASRSGSADAGPGVRQVSFDLRAGERLVIVGETGAGKSTLLRLVLGLDTPDQGEVRLGDAMFSPAPPSVQRALRARIQPVFQDPTASFDPRWSVGRIVAEPLGLLDPPLSPAEMRVRVDDVLQQVGLSPEDGSRLARTFSGGQRQRIALARALAVRPQVLVLDEATSALDAVSRGEILALLNGLIASAGLACLMVTHDLALVRAFADTVAVLRAGRIVEMGPAEAVLTRPATRYTRSLLAASPDLEQVIASRRTGR